MSIILITVLIGFIITISSISILASSNDASKLKSKATDLYNKEKFEESLVVLFRFSINYCYRSERKECLLNFVLDCL